ncbi:MAG: helix-turn-helix domain-containing protein [Candidatus Obscuribacterales bacterium]|nr:helix-turn-helix domain-containing protein [Candidatus Obscuribacterales bacterium]
MSDTARDYQLSLASPMDGLDELFDAEVVPGTTKPYQVGPTEGLPVEQAAKILGLSSKTVKDRLRKGTLQGYKVADKFGERWMVCLKEHHQVLPGTTDLVVPTKVGPTNEDEPVLPGPTDCEVAATVSSEQSPEMLALLALLEQRDRELQAAAFRNGYLESQLEIHREQIKLLTDSQHKQGWWSRLAAWFMGGR